MADLSSLPPAADPREQCGAHAYAISDLHERDKERREEIGHLFAALRHTHAMIHENGVQLAALRGLWENVSARVEADGQRIEAQASDIETLRTAQWVAAGREQQNTRVWKLIATVMGWLAAGISLAFNFFAQHTQK